MHYQAVYSPVNSLQCAVERSYLRPQAHCGFLPPECNLAGLSGLPARTAKGLRNSATNVTDRQNMLARIIGHCT